MTWTPDEVKRRLREAAQTMRRTRPERHLRPDGYRSTWPGILAALGDVCPDQPANRAAIPSPREIDQMHEALDWLALIADERQRRLVAARALGRRWAGLRAEHDDLSVRRLQQLHAAGIGAILGALNRPRR